MNQTNEVCNIGIEPLNIRWCKERRKLQVCKNTTLATMPDGARECPPCDDYLYENEPKVQFQVLIFPDHDSACLDNIFRSLKPSNIK